MSGAIRVLVADDQGLVREGLVTLLGAAAGIEPVAAANDGEEAVALCARHRPDVVLMDLRMPVMDGVEATRRIRAEQPEIEVVVLTTHADEASILDALGAGARGYLTKDAGIAEIDARSRGSGGASDAARSGGSGAAARLGDRAVTARAGRPAAQRSRRHRCRMS